MWDKYVCRYTELDTAEKHNFPHILEANLNIDQNKLKEYLDYNRLSLNMPKCEFMQIGIHQALDNMLKPNVHVTSEPLRQVMIAKYLGMYILISKMAWTYW